MHLDWHRQTGLSLFLSKIDIHVHTWRKYDRVSWVNVCIFLSVLSSIDSSHPRIISSCGTNGSHCSKNVEKDGLVACYTHLSCRAGEQNEGTGSGFIPPWRRGASRRKKTALGFAVRLVATETFSLYTLMHLTARRFRTSTHPKDPLKNGSIFAHYSASLDRARFP